MNLDLQIKDNFLPNDLFQKLAVYSATLEYSGTSLAYKSKTRDNHVWLSNHIQEDDELLKEIEKYIIKHFGVKIKNLHLAAFTCVNSKKAQPHKDEEVFPNEKHLIIYLNGDPKLNAGTGFYNVLGDDTLVYDLNTAVGCFPNRAVIFNAFDNVHSPLLYNSEDSKPRFSIIIWFEPEYQLPQNNK